MADSYTLSPRRQASPQTKKKGSSSSLNSRGRVLCKSDLKSTIPKPIPYVRNNRDSLRTRSSSSCQSQPVHPSRIPLPVWAADRGKTSTSFQYYPSTTPLPARKQALGRVGELRSHARSQSPEKKNKPDFLRPKSASMFRNPYPNVKAKINSKPAVVPKIKSPLGVRLVATPDSNITDVSRGESVNNEQTVGEETRMTNDEFLEKQRQLLKLYTELRKVQLPKELQPLEMEVCKLAQSKTLGHPEGHSRNNTLLLTEGSPEFLSTFEGQMQEVTEMWLRLICDIVLTKLAVGNASLSRLSLPDPSLDLREEVLKFLSSLPAEGEALHIKLQRIEKEQLKVMTVVVHSVLALFKQHEELKDSHFRLEKTQDQIHFELKEQMAILGEENEELDRKYQRSVEKYNVERTKSEQQEKFKMTLNREIIDMKKLMKCLDGKFHEWDGKTKKIETVCRNLDVSVKNKGVSFEKESKSHRETLSKLKEANAKIENLKKEFTETNEMLNSIEMKNQELKEELLAKKTILEELEQNRKGTLDELSIKTMRLMETEERLSALQAYMGNSNPGIKHMYDISPKLPIESLLKDSQQKELYIQELKKEVNRFEHVLKEKSTREEMLMLQLAELQKQPLENEVTLRTQIKELQYELKDANEEKAELERIIAQKTLELDQRDLLMREHSQILRARDELIPLVQSKQRREKEYVEKLSAIIIDQQKTYFNQADEVYGSSGEPNIHEMMKALEKRYTLDPKLVDKELTFRQEKMTELFNLLEHKQMEMMKMERRISELQGVREEKEMLEKEKEARIFNLQRELEDRKAGKSRGIFSLFSGQDGSC